MSWGFSTPGFVFLMAGKSSFSETGGRSKDRVMLTVLEGQESLMPKTDRRRRTSSTPQASKTNRVMRNLSGLQRFDRHTNLRLE